MRWTFSAFMYEWKCVVFLSFCTWIISLIIMSSKLIHVCLKYQDFILFWLNNIPLYLYLSIHRWVPKLIPSLDYCEKYCSNHGHADISLAFWVHFLWIYARWWDFVGLYDSCIFTILRNLHNVFHNGWTNLCSHQ